MYTNHRQQLTRLLVLLLVIGILILVVASRFSRLPGQEMDPDEVWSIWQTFGTPAQIIAWTPYDWPPGFYLLLGLWKGFVGIDPFPIRVMSVLVYLIGTASLYRVTAHILNRRAAVITILAHAAMGYVIYLSTLLRGYVELMALTPVALLLAIRYFERPSLRRAVPLGIVFALMFYIHLSALFGYAIIGLYTLVVYVDWRKLWRWAVLWIPPGIVAGVLAGPEIYDKFSTIHMQVAGSALVKHPPILQAVGQLYADFVGYPVIPWIILMIAASVLIIQRYRLRRNVIAFGLWVLSPFAMYIIAPVLDFFTPRHLWWLPLGIAVWIGWGVSLIPTIKWRTSSLRRIIPIVSMAAAIVILSAASFWPLPDTYGPGGPLLFQSFKWLSTHVKSGDVMIMDPHVPIPPEMIDYYARVYFPLGLPLVSNPQGYQRVWYLKKDGSQDHSLETAIERDRVPGDFIGPWDALFRLWEAPPDVTGIAFENGMRFHGMEVEDSVTRSLIVKREGDTLRLKLWWSVDQVPTRDYSLGLYLMNTGGSVMIHFDGPPQPIDAPSQTSQWVLGRYYIEERDITLPYPLEAGTYPLELTVYQWWDNVKIAAPPATNSDNLLPLPPVHIKAW